MRTGFSWSYTTIITSWSFWMMLTREDGEHDVVTLLSSSPSIPFSLPSISLILMRRQLLSPISWNNLLSFMFDHHIILPLTVHPLADRITDEAASGSSLCSLHSSSHNQCNHSANYILPSRNPFSLLSLCFPVHMNLCFGNKIADDLLSCSLFIACTCDSKSWSQPISSCCSISSLLLRHSSPHHMYMDLMQERCRKLNRKMLDDDGWTRTPVRIES